VNVTKERLYFKMRVIHKHIVIGINVQKKMSMAYDLLELSTIPSVSVTITKSQQLEDTYVAVLRRINSQSYDHFCNIPLPARHVGRPPSWPLRFAAIGYGPSITKSTRPDSSPQRSAACSPRFFRRLPPIPCVWRLRPYNPSAAGTGLVRIHIGMALHATPSHCAAGRNLQSSAPPRTGGGRRFLRTAVSRSRRVASLARLRAAAGTLCS
jgi:hypothetical protein